MNPVIVRAVLIPVMILLASCGQVFPGAPPHIVHAQDAAPSARDNSKARQYIDKMAGVYKRMQSYSGTAKVSAKITGQPNLPSIRAAVFLQKPHLAAMRFSDGSGTNFVVYNGSTLFETSSRHKNKYVKQPTSSKGVGIMRVLTRAGMLGPGLSLLLTQPDMLPAFVPPSSLALGEPTTVAGVPVVTVVSKREQGQIKMAVTYQIGKNDYLLRQMTFIHTMSGRTVSITETHTDIKINTKLPASTFTYTPPRGAKSVKFFNSPK